VSGASTGGGPSRPLNLLAHSELEVQYRAASSNRSKQGNAQAYEGTQRCSNGGCIDDGVAHRSHPHLRPVEWSR
jgi:hypothetical protein